MILIVLARTCQYILIKKQKDNLLNLFTPTNALPHTKMYQEYQVEVTEDNTSLYEEAHYLV